MPSPLDLLLDPVSLVIFALYAALIVWEAIAPARRLPEVPGWRGKGLLFFALYFFVSSYLPLFWNQYLEPLQLFDLTGLGVAGGTVAGLLVYELGMWGWHSAMHRFRPLWLGFHQMHHSAERLDSFGAFYFSPLDMIGWSALASFCLVLVIGIDPQAAVYVVLLTTFMGVFQHTNIRTPRWLGYLVQRPESHAIHHGRGVHARNYADLPLIDMLFGTFENPPGYQHDSGFYLGASRRLLDMLLARDVSAPPAPVRFTAGYAGPCGPRPSGERPAAGGAQS